MNPGGQNETMSMDRTNFWRVKLLFHWRSFPLLFGCGALLAFAVVAVRLSAQEKNPFVGDARAANVGESQFRANCAFCHGLGARGGGRGPDLTRAQKRHGNSDSDLFRTINEGVPGTAMPPHGATH